MTALSAVAGAATIGPWRAAARIARSRRGLFAVAFVAWTAFHVQPLLLGLVLRAVFDALTGDRPAGPLAFVAAAALVSVDGLRVLIFHIGVASWERCWKAYGILLRSNVLRALLAPGGETAGRMPSTASEAVNRMRDDVEDVIEFLDSWLDTSGVLLFFGLAGVIMVRTDPVATVAVAGPMVVILVVSRFLRPRIAAYRRALRRSTAAVTSFLGDAFGAALAIKAAGAERSVVERLVALDEERRRAALRDRVLTDGFDLATASVVEVSVGLVLLLAAPAMRRGDFTVGDLALFAAYVDQLPGFPRHVGRMLTKNRQAEVSLQRLGRLLPGGRSADLVAHGPLHIDGGLPDVAEPERRLPPLEDLAVRGLGCTHQGSGRGVRDVDLDVRAGTVTVVCGPVGSGKTTLLRALLGLVADEGCQGEVLWNGQLLVDRAAALVPPHAAYVPQVPRLLSEPIADNVLLGRPDAGGDRLASALRLAAVDDDVASMADGAGTLVGPRGVRLSGGQLQRIAAARALATGADLLVLDDLSSALDVETEALLWRRLMEERRGATVIAVSHRELALARADQVVVLRDGAVAAVGPWSSVRSAAVAAAVGVDG